MLLGILEDAFLERNLGGRIDREGQWKVLLQSPDRINCRILLTRLALRGGLPLGGLRVGSLGLFRFCPQAVM
ncbi:hypothetical protein FQZ97_1018290 [compost metagenome]